MPAVPCPECAKKLNVPDNALGKKVRCPGCQAVFVAAFTASAPAAPPKTQAAPSAPPALKKGTRQSEPELLGLDDEPDDQPVGDAVPGLRCASCDAAAVLKLKPNQFSRHPGYVCARCDTRMRRAGTTGNYYAAADG